ncbi:3-dehydroquinate synthase [Bacillus sp. AFS015802]|uniref:3-dehydroquinate synthase n=1 Tax=Bacillus sp. AFS015802 TaxID=2033486 RepID=UPI000BF30849|nr:3-dehydroquinate synthase [Bacillus sp. AFS015802]PFA70037.1 3-dehydroquinate synthase [Bacillus sp. AFS015802]
MKQVTIQTASKTYEVKIGVDMTKEIVSFIKESFPGVSKVWVIADESVYKLHGGAFQEALRQSFDVTTYQAPKGERAKSFSVYEDAITHGLKHHVDRKSLVVAFGGGAIGDLAGFVASTYMRGIPFISVPTTILAHDSAVGGKVAINHPLGKNMVGQFYQPEGVFFELNYFSSLPKMEVLSGFSEVIKHAFLSDHGFLNDLMHSFRSAENLDEEFLTDCLIRGIQVKGQIVSKDERESNIRAFLNFGHTYGHAVESASGYGNRTHGESVMIGMVYALFLSERYTGLSFDLEAFIGWVKSLGYNLKVPSHISFDVLYEGMKRDKKSLNGNPVFVLLKDIGVPVMSDITAEDLKRADEYIRQV